MKVDEDYVIRKLVFPNKLMRNINRNPHATPTSPWRSCLVDQMSKNELVGSTMFYLFIRPTSILQQGRSLRLGKGPIFLDGQAPWVGCG